MPKNQPKRPIFAVLPLILLTTGAAILGCSKDSKTKAPTPDASSAAVAVTPPPAEPSKEFLYVTKVTSLRKQPVAAKKIVLPDKKNPDRKKKVSNWITTLYRGEQVEKMEQQQKFTLVRLSSDEEGWIENSALAASSSGLATVFEYVDTYEDDPDPEPNRYRRIAPASVLIIIESAGNDRVLVNYVADKTTYVDSTVLVKEQRETTVARMGATLNYLKRSGKKKDAQLHLETIMTEYGDSELADIVKFNYEQKRWQPPSDNNSATARGNTQRSGVYYRQTLSHHKQPIWSSQEVTQASGDPVVVDGVLYIADAAAGKTALVALDAATGATRWRHATKGPITVTPAVAAGAVFYGTQKGAFVALDAATGKQRWHQDDVGEVVGDPAVHGDLVIYGQRNKLKALSTLQGEQKWTYEAEQLLTSAPALADHLAFISATDEVVALELASGSKRWSFAIDEDTVFKQPVVSGDRVYVPSAHKVYALQVRSGAMKLGRGVIHYYKARQSRHIGQGVDYEGNISGDLVVSGNNIIVPLEFFCWNRNSEGDWYVDVVMAIDREKGALQWTKDWSLNRSRDGSVQLVQVGDHIITKNRTLLSSAGSSLWSHQVASSQVLSTPVADSNVLYLAHSACSSCDDKGTIQAYGQAPLAKEDAAKEDAGTAKKDAGVPVTAPAQ